MTSCHPPPAIQNNDTNHTNEEREGVTNRRLILCEFMGSQEPSTIILPCSVCSDFYLYCCHCNSTRRKDGLLPPNEIFICHHWPVVITDGACPGNGSAEARAGIGIVGGVPKEGWSWGAAVRDTMFEDDQLVTLRTSQRAELLAAIVGITFRRNLNGIVQHSDDKQSHGRKEEDRDGCCD